MFAAQNPLSVGHCGHLQVNSSDSLLKPHFYWVKAGVSQFNLL